MIFERILQTDFLRDFDLEWISGNNFLTALSPNLGHSSSLKNIINTNSIYLLISTFYAIKNEKPNITFN